MPRTVILNYARVTAPPTSHFDPQTGAGTLTAQYVVGSLVNGTYTDLPNATLKGTAVIPIDLSHTSGQFFAQLQGLIAQQEGLDLTQGDQVLFP